ncbi:DUF6134 family protein [Henriciella sp.]|uniref:DUF6134 family protein n=1 Tax=Henriciella sp. TaxID=1968823 RepID=UPI00262923A0|nr:DUF6134 family protein [Henriciella sp.]
MIRISIAAVTASVLTYGVHADTSDQPDDQGPVSTEAPQAWKPQDGDTIRFNVYRKGDTKFGSHTVNFNVESDGNFTATSEVDLKAGLGPITVFRYTLNATETWEDGKLVQLDGNTNDDGDNEQVSASLEGGALQVDGSGYTGKAPLGVIPSSHWNIQQVFSSEILSTESGQLLETKATRIGEETLEIDGQSVDTVHYRLVSDLTVDLWYDEQNRWVQLSFEARGQKIDYRLASLY